MPGSPGSYAPEIPSRLCLWRAIINTNTKVGHQKCITWTHTLLGISNTVKASKLEWENYEIRNWVCTWRQPWPHLPSSSSISDGASILSIPNIMCKNLTVTVPSGDDLRSFHWNCDTIYSVHYCLVHWTSIQHQKTWLCRKVAKLWCSPKHYSFMWANSTDSGM